MVSLDVTYTDGRTCTINDVVRPRIYEAVRNVTGIDIVSTRTNFPLYQGIDWNDVTVNGSNFFTEEDALSALNMALFTGKTSGGGGFDPDAQALFDQMDVVGSSPDETRKLLINDLYLDLKGIGPGPNNSNQFQYLRRMNNFDAAQEENAAYVDFIDPLKSASAVGTLLYIPSMGFVGGVDSYIDQNFIASTEMADVGVGSLTYSITNLIIPPLTNSFFCGNFEGSGGKVLYMFLVSGGPIISLVPYQATTLTGNLLPADPNGRNSVITMKRDDNLFNNIIGYQNGIQFHEFDRSPAVGILPDISTGQMARITATQQYGGPAMAIGWYAGTAELDPTIVDPILRDFHVAIGSLPPLV